MSRSFPVARAAAQWRLLLSLAATALILVSTLAFAVGWLTDAARSAVVAAVDGAAPNDRHTVLTVPVAGDPAAQAAAVEGVIRGRFGDGLRIEPDVAPSGGTSRWTLTVDPDAFVPWTIASTTAGLDDLGVLVQQVPDLAPQGASTEGGLATTLESATGNVLAVIAVAPVPLALVAIGGIIALLQLSRLLARARAGESALLRARGLDEGSARRHAWAEAGVIAVLGAAIGWLAGAAAVALAGGAGYAIALASTWPVAVVAGIAVAITVAAGGRSAEHGVDDRAGRGRAAVTGLGAGLVVLAAAVLLWQLTSLEGDAADLTADPWSLAVVALAPAAGLAAVATLALLLFGPIATAVAAAGRRSRALSPALPARMVARHIAIFGVVVALLALSGGGAAFGGTMVATWQRAAAQTASLVAGADARATVAAGAVPASAVRKAAGAPDVRAAGAAVSDAADAGGATLAVVALPSASVAQLVEPLPSAGVDPAALAAAVAVDGPLGEPLGAGASGIRMTFAVTAGGGSRPTLPGSDMLAGDAWFLDGLGTPVQVPLTLVIAPDESSRVRVPTYPDCAVEAECPFEDRWSSGTLTATAQLPDGDDWVLVGFTLGFPNSPGSQSPGLLPEQLTTIEGAVLTWPSEAPLVLNQDQPTATLTAVPAPQTIPAVVTPRLADDLDLAVGGTFEITLDRSRGRIPVEIAAIAPAVPGTSADSGAFVALDAATQIMLARSGGGVVPSGLWASGSGAAAAVRSALPDAAVIDASGDDGFSDALLVPWWIAATATALLSGIALVAAAVGLAQQRGTDVFVLRGLGVTARRQSRSRTGELVVVAAAATVLGAGLGLALAVVCAPVLTRAAVAGVPAVIGGEVSFGVGPLVVACAVVVVAVVAASVVVGRLIAAQALAGRVREAT